MTMRKPVMEKCLKEKYVSCIRINGVPILPPLITPEKCAAIKYYKKQAMKVEKQIQERKKALFLKQQNFDPPIQKVHTVENTDFTETILDCCRNIETYLSTTFDIDSTQVDAQKHTPILTCDIQASQYLNNELVLFNSKQEDCTNVDIDKYQKCDESLSSRKTVDCSRKQVSHLKTIDDENISPNKKQVVHGSLNSRMEERNSMHTSSSKDDSSSLSKAYSNEGFRKPWLDELNKLHDAFTTFEESFDSQKYSFNDTAENNSINRISSFDQYNLDSSDAVNSELPSVSKNVNQCQIYNGRSHEVNHSHIHQIKSHSRVDQIKNHSENQKQVEQIKSQSVHQSQVDQIKNESLNQNKVSKVKNLEINQNQNQSSQFTKLRIQEGNKFGSFRDNAQNQSSIKIQTKHCEKKQPFNSECKEEEKAQKKRIGEIQSFEKPQLIRSNSYVLETPSPVLLEHLKKNKDMNAIQRCWSSSDNIYADKRFFNLDITQNFNETKFEGFINIHTQSEVGSNKNLNKTNCGESFTKSVSDNKCGEQLIKNSDSNLNVTRSYYKKPDSVKSEERENVELNSTSSVLNFDTSCTETELRNISDNETESDGEDKVRQFIDNNVPKSGEDENERVVINEGGDKSENLKEILKNIPEEYSKKILEYLEKHEDFGAPQSFSTPNQEVTHNQTIYYSVEDDSKIGNYLNEASKELDLSKDLNLREYSSMVVYDTRKTVLRNNMTNKKDVKEKSVDEEYEQYQKAASVIGAAVKGYLTRRLFKTERVQNLIDVINEALVCAVQLHSENLENIDEYDVELHRRLIQQVSAACYAFHDVFFNTPISEQMSIIAMDRQKKHRPPSITSTRSTPRKSTKALLSGRSMSAV